MGAALGDWGRRLALGHRPSSWRPHTGRQTAWIVWAGRPPRLAAWRPCRPLLYMTLQALHIELQPRFATRPCEEGCWH